MKIIFKITVLINLAFLGYLTLCPVWANSQTQGSESLGANYTTVHELASAYASSSSKDANKPERCEKPLQFVEKNSSQSSDTFIGQRISDYGRNNDLDFNLPIIHNKFPQKESSEDG
jgi:hypothetical protein